MKIQKIGFLSIVIIFHIFSIGCSPKAMLNKIVPNEADTFAREYINLLRKGDFQTAITLLNPELVNPKIESNLKNVASFFGHGEPLAVEVVGCNVFSNNNIKRSDLTYQYQFTDSWLLASVVVKSVEGTQEILGVNVKPIPTSIQDMNALTFSGKGISNYIMMIMSMLIVLIILYALILCCKAKVKRKWLWVIFILIGVGKLSLNWTTGEIGFNPLSFHVQLFGSSLIRGGIYGPWFLTISLPLGAIIFLFKRRILKNKKVEALKNDGYYVGVSP
jgi:hypothetical protein